MLTLRYKVNLDYDTYMELMQLSEDLNYPVKYLIPDIVSGTSHPEIVFPYAKAEQVLVDIMNDLHYYKFRKVTGFTLRYNYMSVTTEVDINTILNKWAIMDGENRISDNS